MRATVLAATAVFILFGASAARAQSVVYDHLQCFKVRDAYNFHATVDLAPQPGNIPGFDVTSGCTVMLKATEFCIPVAKTIVKTDDPNTLSATGQDLQPGFLCYKLKCPSKLAAVPFQVGDQFGIRNVTPSTYTRLCAPADW